MDLSFYLTATNYVAWFIFMFISVVWVLVMLQNRNRGELLKVWKQLPKISIIIPAYNEEKTIAKTIESVLALDYPKRLLDIIMVNDCSKDHTREKAEPFAKNGDIRLLNNPVNKGKAYSLNHAMRMCNGDFVACVDADSIVERDILKKLLPYFYNDKVGAVTPALKVWKSESYLEKVQSAEYILNIFLRKMLSFLDSVHVTPGVFSIYRLSVLKEVGGFDENNLTEDMEIALKIHDAGYSIESNLNAMSYTMCPQGWRELYRQRLRWYRGGLENMVKYKHMMFNPSYGNLGVFFLPMNFIAIMAIIVIFLNMAYTQTDSIVSTYMRMSLIRFDVLSLIGTVDLPVLLESFLSTQLLFSMAGIILGALVLWVSFRTVGMQMRGNTRGYIMYLFLFPLFMMGFWFAAIVHEVAGARKRW